MQKQIELKRPNELEVPLAAPTASIAVDLGAFQPRSGTVHDPRNTKCAKAQTDYEHAELDRRLTVESKQQEQA